MHRGWLGSVTEESVVMPAPFVPPALSHVVASLPVAQASTRFRPACGRSPVPGRSVSECRRHIDAETIMNARSSSIRFPRRGSNLILVLAVLALPAMAAPHEDHHAGPGQLGKVDFPVSCSKDAQPQ